MIGISSKYTQFSLCCNVFNKVPIYLSIYLSIHVLSIHILLIHALSIHVLSIHVFLINVLSIHILSVHVLLIHVLSLHVLSIHVLLIHVRINQVHVLSYATWNDMKLRRSVRMSYMYGICCAPVLFGKPLAKNIFSNPFPKKCSVCESQKSGFGLIPRIHPECGFYGFVIRFWIFPKKPTLKSPL